MAVTQITADVLFRQTPHGLIQTNPVNRAESQQRFGQLLNGKGTKSTDWKPIFKYNVICDHTHCRANPNWKQRRHFKSFRKNHWKRAHPDDTNVKVRAVSFWTTTETDGKTHCVQEYRLVNDDLEYLGSAERADIDMVLPQDTAVNVVSDIEPQIHIDDDAASSSSTNNHKRSADHIATYVLKTFLLFLNSLFLHFKTRR